MDRDKLQSMIDNYENGNKADFRAELVELTPLETATLISMWQPYHRAITAIQLSYEVLN
jgi:hypothetical protein